MHHVKKHLSHSSNLYDRTVQNSLKFVSSPLVEEEEGEEDILLELTFSPQQTGTTIPSSTYVSHK